MPTRDLIEGQPVLLVIDIQKGSFLPGKDSGIPHMPGHVDRMRRARTVIDAARRAGVPIVFLQEAHRPDLVDFGRELPPRACIAWKTGRRRRLPPTRSACARTIMSSENGAIRHSSARIWGFF